MLALLRLIRPVVLLVLLLAGLLQGAVALGQVAAPGPQLAFVSNRGGDDDIYLMDFQRRITRNLTRTPGADRFPVWSPDGSHLAFVSDREGQFDVYTLDVATGQLRRLTEQRAAYNELVWSPDSRFLAYTARVLRGDGRTDVYIHIADMGSNNVVRVTSPGSNGLYSPVWSADSARLRFEVSVGYNTHRYHVNPAGSNPRADAPDNGIRWVEAEPAAPPTGLRASVHSANAVLQICVFDEAGVMQSCIDDGPVNVQPSWRPQLRQT